MTRPYSLAFKQKMMDRLMGKGMPGTDPRKFGSGGMLWDVPSLPQWAWRKYGRTPEGAGIADEEEQELVAVGAS